MQVSSFGLGGLLLGVMGMIVCGIGIIAAVRNRRFIGQAARATGTIIGHVTGGMDGTLYFPVVRFQTRDGQIIESQSPIGTTPLLFPVGKSVSVFYDPQRPTDARIQSGCLLWGLPTILIVLGLGISLMSLVFVLLQWLVNQIPSR